MNCLLLRLVVDACIQTQGHVTVQRLFIFIPFVSVLGASTEIVPVVPSTYLDVFGRNEMRWGRTWNQERVCLFLTSLHPLSTD